MVNVIKCFKEERFFEIVIYALFVALVTIIAAYASNNGRVLEIGWSISLALTFFALTFQNKKLIKIMPIVISILAESLFLAYGKNPVSLEIGIAVIAFYIIAAEYYGEK